MSYTMYLDDLRTPKNNYNVIVRSYEEAVAYVQAHGVPQFISFDHDLGCIDDGTLLKSGYDFAKWLVESSLDDIISLPNNFDFNVHSANPIGKENIETILRNYLNHVKQ